MLTCFTRPCQFLLSLTSRTSLIYSTRTLVLCCIRVARLWTTWFTNACRSLIFFLSPHVGDLKWFHAHSHHPFCNGANIQDKSSSKGVLADILSLFQPRITNVKSSHRSIALQRPWKLNICPVCKRLFHPVKPVDSAQYVQSY